MEIRDLRDQLASIDRQLLELVGKRQAVVRAIGETKDRRGSSLRSYAQEKVVLERARQEASRIGISGDLATDLMRRLIHDSLSQQERRRVQLRGSGSGRRALVIGGSGRMGAWMTRFLQSQDFEVEVADPVAPEGGIVHRSLWHEGELDHDFIIVAAPLRTSQTILGDLAERRPPGVVFDVGSLKTPLKDPLARLAEEGVEVASVHPMFGPETDMLSGRHVILVDLGCPRANDSVRELFGSTMAELVEMSLDDHDRVISFVLGLSHALNIAFVTALAASGESVPHLAELSSTTFDRQLAVTASVTQENPHLYFEIQHLNDHGGQSLMALREAVERIQQVVVDGDEASFVELMEQGSRYVADSLGQRVRGDLR